MSDEDERALTRKLINEGVDREGRRKVRGEEGEGGGRRERVRAGG